MAAQPEVSGNLMKNYRYGFVPGKDIRVRRTKAWLYDALILLNNEMEYEQITVSALAKKAGVARQTFYRNYGCIDDILLERASYIIQSVFSEPEKHLLEKLESGIKLILKNKELAMIVNDANLGEIVSRMLSGNLSEEIREEHPFIPKRDVDQITVFIAAGLRASLQSWLKNDKGLSEKELIRRLLILSKSALSICKKGGLNPSGIFMGSV